MNHSDDYCRLATKYTGEFRESVCSHIFLFSTNLTQPRFPSEERKCEGQRGFRLGAGVKCLSQKQSKVQN